MALLYKVIRDNREESNNLYYGRAVQLSTINIEGLAEIMQRNCTVKKSDIKAVLTELVETMNDQLQNSMTVKLDGFGSFKLSMKTKGAEKEEDFTISKNVVGLRCRFLPEGHKDAATGKMSRTFLNGTTLQKVSF